MKINTIKNIAIIGGFALGGYLIYKFFTKKDVAKETGKAIYGGVYGSDLDQEIKPDSSAMNKSRQQIRWLEIENPTQKQLVAKTVSREVAEDIHKQGFGKSLLFAPVTIGAGLGALTQQQRFYDTLNPEQLQKARLQEFNRRAEWMYKHPLESTIGFPAQFIHEFNKPEGAKSAPLFDVIKIISNPLKIKLW